MMKGKLIKLGLSEGYRLDDLNGNYIASTLNGKNKLSLKNCQAIENGYDLDEVAKLSYDCDPYIAEYLEQEFKRGFQKAIELLGDKKFDEEDILIAIEAGYHAGINHNVDEEESGDKIIRLKDSVIPSLQQTEWDVEIVYDRDCYSSAGRCDKSTMANCIICTPVTYLKDADGCLILKRK